MVAGLTYLCSFSFRRCFNNSVVQNIVAPYHIFDVFRSTKCQHCSVGESVCQIRV